VVKDTEEGKKVAGRIIELSKNRSEVFKTKDEEKIDVWNQEFSQLLLKLEAERIHRYKVQEALAEGKVVPPEVMEDYPELGKKGAVETPKEKRKKERKVPDVLKDKVIGLAKDKVLKQAKFQESLGKEVEKAEKEVPVTFGKPGYKKGKVVPWKMEHYAKKAVEKKGEGWEVVKQKDGWVVQESEGVRVETPTTAVKDEKKKGIVESLVEPLKGKGEEGAITLPIPTTVTKTLKSAARLADEYLGAISTRLGNIDQSIKNRMRAFELDSALKAEKATKMLLPFIEKNSKMSKKDYADFDLARKNRDAEEIKRLSEKYGLESELVKVRTLLDAVLKEAAAVGYDAKRLDNYHPREVTDLSGLLDFEHGNDNWSVVEEVIKNKERKLGRPLTKEEEVKLTNSLFRGYADERITLSKPGQLKLRRIQTITEERNKFYADSNSALLRYVNDVVLAVEAKKLFGSHKNKGIDIDDTIGAFILKLSKEKKISPSQARDVRSILKARFDPKGTSGAATTFKSLTLIDVMGSFQSAATQVGDMAWALYNSGVIETASVLPRALARKSIFTKEDLGISKIGAEFSDKSTSAKAVDTVFKAIGLTTVDAMGKEVLINSAYNKAVKKSLAKDNSKWKKELEGIFGQDADKVMVDFANKRDTRNTRLYMLHKLSDFQPATLSELPEGFLKGGNWRILYMLKSFDIKKFDVYRREVFQQIAKPGIKGKLIGIKNLIKLAMFLTAMEASADVIKDLLSGKEVVISDLVIQNLADFFISRYRRGTMRREGVGSGFAKQIVPPFKLINAIGKDVLTAGDK